MMSLKITAFLAVLFVAAASAVVAQANGQAQQSATPTVEAMMIRTNSISADRAQNMLALSYTAAAIERGNVDGEVMPALERLVMVGLRSRTVAGGRVANNFPDVRREAARQLGLVGTEEARNILIQVIAFENEPIALQEMITSIGAIESDDNSLAVTAIVRTAGRWHRSPAPSNHVALATINALERISGRDGGITNANAFQYLFDVARGPYIPVVRARANEVLDSQREHAQ